MSNAGTQQEETDYVATENGKTWKGSVSEYDEHKPDLKTLGAGKASTANAKGLVACDYYNGTVATLRLTPDAPAASAAKAIAPTGKQPTKKAGRSLARPSFFYFTKKISA